MMLAVRLISRITVLILLGLWLRAQIGFLYRWHHADGKWPLTVLDVALTVYAIQLVVAGHWEIGIMHPLYVWLLYGGLWFQVQKHKRGGG